MKKSNLATVLFVASLLGLTSANATTVHLADGTVATGITGLVVGSTVYDVGFTGTVSSNDWVAQLDVTSVSEANTVILAIGAALNGAGATTLRYTTTTGFFDYNVGTLFYGTSGSNLVGLAIIPGNNWAIPGAANIPLGTARPFAIDLTASAPDSDGDGVADASDNCRSSANADQRDTNADNIGNVCDADLNDDCSVNFGDLAELKASFFPNPYNADADFNGDGFVNFGDLAFMKSTFFNGDDPGPGPSGLPNDCD